MKSSKHIFDVTDLLNIENLASPIQEAALSKILFGIAKEWQLNLNEVSSFLDCSEENVSDWKELGRITIGKNSAVYQRLIQFIKLWQGLSSMIVSTERQIEWIRKPNQGFGGKCPLELVQSNPENLRTILEVVTRLRNP